MTNHTMKEKFLKSYDTHVDDVFAYCFRETAHRDVSKYLTRNIFTEVWDAVVYYGLDSIENLKRFIFRTAKDHILKFNTDREQQRVYYNNLWSLTLSQ
jgi:hypothetical protein